MKERTSGTRVMASDLERVLDVIADIENYPEWATQFTSASVEERSHAGRPRLARFVMDAGVLKDTFSLEYTFTESAHGATVAWHLVSAEFLKRLDGMYRLTPVDGGTEVRYELEVDPGLPVLAVLRQRAEATVIRTALDDLAGVLEAPAGV